MLTSAINMLGLIRAPLTHELAVGGLHPLLYMNF